MKRLSVSLVVAAFVVGMVPLAAQQTTATRFFTAYQAAWAKAKSFQDIVAMHSKASQAELAKMPADQQKMMFEMSKEMAPKGVKVVKETATATGATLELTGKGPDGKPIKGKAELVKEGGEWRMVKQNWQM